MNGAEADDVAVALAEAQHASAHVCAARAMRANTKVLERRDDDDDDDDDGGGGGGEISVFTYLDSYLTYIKIMSGSVAKSDCSVLGDKRSIAEIVADVLGRQR